MQTPALPYTRIEVEPGLRKIILFEIIFPMILLVIGITTGFLQVLYRSGVIQSKSFLGIE